MSEICDICHVSHICVFWHVGFISDFMQDFLEKVEVGNVAWESPVSAQVKTSLIMHYNSNHELHVLLMICNILIY